MHQLVDRQRIHTMSLTHLSMLEAEAIHIMREVAASAENPVMLFSVGKIVVVMLHLAKKAFFCAAAFPAAACRYDMEIQGHV